MQTEGEDLDSEFRDGSEETVDSGEAAVLSEESGAEEHAHEMNATGFALMKSAARSKRDSSRPRTASSTQRFALFAAHAHETN